MEMNVRDDVKIVEIWLSNAEKSDPALRERLKDIYAEYKKKKYLVGVFESGQGDLYENTLALLSYNRKRLAQKEVQRAKEANPEKPSVLDKLQTFRSQIPPPKPGRHAEQELSLLHYASTRKRT